MNSKNQCVLQYYNKFELDKAKRSMPRKSYQNIIQQEYEKFKTEYLKDKK